MIIMIIIIVIILVLTVKYIDMEVISVMMLQYGLV